MNSPAIITNYDKPLQCNIQRLEHCLDGVTLVEGVQHRLSETFISLFLYNYFDLPTTVNEALSISNWTHHTYFAIRSTAKLLGLVCTFETMGRLDAVIDTGDGYPGIVLVAEWETNGLSIFGEHRELEKLWSAANGQPYADGFIFVYCPVEKLYEVTRRIVEFWQDKESSRETPPSLFVGIVATRYEKRNTQFLFVRTMEVQKSVVKVWHDLSFVDAVDYLECVEKL
jgi:hypothetical protein